VNKYFRIAVVPVLLYGILVAWLVDDYHRHRNHLEGILRSRAHGVISSVELGIANMGCKRRIQLRNLEGLLDETIEAGSATGIALYQDGKELANVGEGIESEHFEPGLHERWAANHLVVGRPLRAPPPCCKDQIAPPEGVTEEGSSSPVASQHDDGESDEGSATGKAAAAEIDVQTPATPNFVGDFLVVAESRTPTLRELRQASRHAIVLGVIGLFMVIAVSFWRIHKGRATQLATELLVAEERLKMTRDRSLSAAGLAHETKNPLGIVRAISQVLADNGLQPEEVKQYAKKISEEVDRTVSRINEFLKYAHPSLPKPEKIVLDPFFTKLRELISEGNGDHLICHVDGGGLTIRADAGQLRQALFNLLNNAVDAVRARKEEENGSYRGAISLRAERTTDQRCSIVVEDNGSGISEEDLSQIFNPYFSKRNDGSGLGLAIVKDISSSHGWTIDARSQCGRGATFVVSNVETV